VVYGFLTSSFYSTLVGVYLPGKYALLQEVKKISFEKPVYIDDELTIHGIISFMNEAYKVIEIKAMIKNQNSEIISRAKINVGLLDEVQNRDNS
jgi:3-hydroxybutyryl-CoA dehydratase